MSNSINKCFPNSFYRIFRNCCSFKKEFWENTLSIISSRSVPLNLTILTSCSKSNLEISFAKNNAPALFKWKIPFWLIWPAPIYSKIFFKSLFPNNSRIVLFSRTSKYNLIASSSTSSREELYKICLSKALLNNLLSIYSCKLFLISVNNSSLVENDLYLLISLILLRKLLLPSYLVLQSLIKK